MKESLNIYKEDDIYKIVGLDPNKNPIDTGIISKSLREALVKTRENYRNEE